MTSEVDRGRYNDNLDKVDLRGQVNVGRRRQTSPATAKLERAAACGYNDGQQTIGGHASDERGDQ